MRSRGMLGSLVVVVVIFVFEFALKYIEPEAWLKETRGHVEIPHQRLLVQAQLRPRICIRGTLTRILSGRGPACRQVSISAGRPSEAPCPRGHTYVNHAVARDSRRKTTVK